MSMPRLLKFLLRLAISLGAIALAFSQISVHDVLPLLKAVKPGYVLLAIVCLHLGYSVSGLRMRHYLARYRIMLSTKLALQLHYASGLFTAVVPGGMGGDAYKTWWLKRHYQGGLFDMVKVMLMMRLNGLWILGLFVCVLMMLSPAVTGLLSWARIGLVGVMLAGTISYHVLSLLIFKEGLGKQAEVSIYSLLLQAMVWASATSLALALGLLAHGGDYVILFLLSTILAMLPISIGGIGVRELVLLHGSQWLGLPVGPGVSLALSFSLINLTLPLTGALVYSLWKPELP